jgi:hypothetical protein
MTWKLNSSFFMKFTIMLVIAGLCYKKIDFLKAFGSNKRAAYKPGNSSLCVIANYFNPTGFKRNYKLYMDFEKRMMSSGVRLITVELAFDEKPFQITDSDNPDHVQLRTSDVLWYKENLINIGIRRAPKQCKYIAWIDNEVEFLNQNWVTDTIDALKSHKVVQLFEVANYLAPNGTAIQNYVSYGTCVNKMKQGLTFKDFEKVYNTSILLHFCHSGFAWAARRSFLHDIGGLFDKDIVGDSDFMMVQAFTGNIDSNSTFIRKWYNTKNLAYIKEIFEWQNRTFNRLKSKIGFVDGRINHIFHGSPILRGYDVRKTILQSELVPYKPAKHIYYDNNGLIHLKSEVRDYFSVLLKAYFENRKDDEDFLW